MRNSLRLHSVDGDTIAMAVYRPLVEYMNPAPSGLRVLAKAYAAGPLRDTLMIALGGTLVALGYVLGAWVTSGVS